MTDTTTPAGTGGYLLAKADEGELAFGSPHLFKAAAHNTGGRFDFLTMEMAPMTGPPLHFHEEQDDTFYVLEGVLTVQADNEIIDLGPGEFISIPPRMAHTFDNVHNGGEVVRTINVMTPGGLFPTIEDMLGSHPGPSRLKASRQLLDGTPPTSWGHRCASRSDSNSASLGHRGYDETAANRRIGAGESQAFCWSVDLG